MTSNAARRDEPVGETYSRIVYEQLESMLGTESDWTVRPRSVHAHFLTSQGKYEEAHAHLRVLLERDSSEWEADPRRNFHLFYGEYLAAVGRFEEAYGADGAEPGG